MDPLELSPLVTSRRPRDDVIKRKETKRWKVYRLSGLFMTTVGGLLLMIRVVLDGKVSFYGTLLKLIALLLTGINFAFDPSLSWDARVSYGGPKLFGIITTAISLVGIIMNNDDFYDSL